MVMKTMWNRRFRLFIGTIGGNVLRGLDLRSSRPWSRSPVFNGALAMSLRPTNGYETSELARMSAGTVEKPVSPPGSAGACQGRRITNPPQVTNLPHVDPTLFITVGAPRAHGDRSEICPIRQRE